MLPKETTSTITIFSTQSDVATFCCSILGACWSLGRNIFYVDQKINDTSLGEGVSDKVDSKERKEKRIFKTFIKMRYTKPK